MANDVDTYIAAQPEPQRSTLTTMRRLITGLLPRAQEGMAYGAPAWLVDGTAVAGISSAAKHVAYLPHSGSVVAELGDALAGYDVSKGAVKMPADNPMRKPVVKALIAARLAELVATPDAKGFHREVYDDGGLKAKGKLKDGELHGFWQWWRKDGSLLRSGTFDRGAQVREWTTYDRTSTPVKVTDFGR